ncbi:methyltransferase domain-containing protein [Roseibium sp. HPY-6]|uniref:class I SAM-dependent methyltransferase n=1 Tax=Roseibium sp. HPY-6 TaxID=3229852 RepID=UPI00338EA6CF
MLQTKEKTSYSGFDELVAIDKAMPRYNSFIAETIARSLGSSKKPVDFGAGIGTLADCFHAKTGLKPTCVEVDETCRGILISKGYETLQDISGVDNFDFVFSSNVLEHIEDDQEILKCIFDRLEKNGQIVLYLPAFQKLFSDLDASVGHYRRYDKRMLVDKLTSAGFRVEEVFYADCVGFFISLFFRYFGYSADKGLASPSRLETYDKFIFPFSKALDSLGLKHFFGKNICVRAKKISE